MNNMLYSDTYPRQSWENPNHYRGGFNSHNDQRFGGFLLPFLAGTIVGGPLFGRRPYYPAPYPIYQPYPQYVPYPYPYPYPYYPRRRRRW